jgi:hypothetical protein
VMNTDACERASERASVRPCRAPRAVMKEREKRKGSEGFWVSAGWWG